MTVERGKRLRRFVVSVVSPKIRSWWQFPALTCPQRVKSGDMSIDEYVAVQRRYCRATRGHPIVRHWGRVLDRVGWVYICIPAPQLSIFFN